MKSIPRLLLLVWALVLITPLCLPSASAAAADETLSMEAAPLLGGFYRPGTWMPVRLTLVNRGADRQVEVRVGLASGAQYTTRLTLPNSADKSVIVYAYLPQAPRKLQVTLLQDGVQIRSQTLAIEPLGVRSRLVGVLAAPGANPRVPARLADGSPVTTVTLTPSALPTHPLGLSSFDTLVLDDVATADLSAAQRDALQNWMFRGGQLLVGGGAGASRTLAGFPETLQPVTVPAVVTLPAEQVLGSAGADIAPVPVASLVARDGVAGRKPYAVPLPSLPSSGAPLYLEQSYGRGAFSVFALPLSHPALLRAADPEALWGDLLRQPAALPGGTGPIETRVDSFVEGSMAATLTGLPSLEFPPIGTFVVLLLTYIIVVGPGMYLVLRRLDRQALGWVLVPIVTLIFAGMAYAMGFAQRGGDVLFNQVTLIEPLDEQTDTARVRSFIGVFSPSDTAYAFTTDPDDRTGDTPMLRPISIQGPWDGGAGAGGGMFVQEALDGLRAEQFAVPQWSMRALAVDTVTPYKALKARVIFDGKTLRGEVQNTSDQLLEDVTLVQGDRLLSLGNLAPGEQRSGELKARTGPGVPVIQTGAPLSYIIYGEEMERSSKMNGQPPAPDVQLRMRLLDALFAYGPSTRVTQPMLIAWSRTPALDIQPVDQRLNRQHMAMITMQPQVEFASSEIDLPQGWLIPHIVDGASGFCYGNQGVGVSFGPNGAQMQLQLPRDFYGMRASELVLLANFDGPWLAGTVVELYDWQQGQWRAQSVDGRPLPIKAPEAFLSSNGLIRVRVSTSNGQNIGGTCFYIDAKLKGSLS